MFLDFATVAAMMTSDASNEKKLSLINEQIGCRNKEIQKLAEWKDLLYQKIARESGDKHMQNFVKKTIDPES